MYYSAKTTVSLDPVKESETIEQYRKDKGWVEIGGSTVAVTFICENTPYEVPEMYIPSRRDK